MDSGNLGPEWGYHIQESESGPLSTESLATDILTVKKLVSDTGAMHRVCLEAFNKHANLSGVLDNTIALKLALQEICLRCKADPFTDEDIEDLWCSQLNFSDFFFVTHELFKSIHRAVTLQDENICVCPDHAHQDRNFATLL